jgi:hypothetical protein
MRRRQLGIIKLMFVNVPIGPPVILTGAEGFSGNP